MHIPNIENDTPLNEQQIRLQSAALDAAGSGIVITDMDGIIQWVNPAFTTLTGYTIGEVVSHNPRDLVKSGRHSTAFYRAMWDTILAGHVWQGELINRRKNGSLYHEEQTITPLRDAQGKVTHFVAVKQDVSARHLNQQARYLLLSLPTTIADAPSFESALEAALGLVCTYADWDLGEVWLPVVDPASGSISYLELLMQYHQDPEMDAAFLGFSQQFRFRPGEGLPGQVLASQDIVWVPKISAEPNFLRKDLAQALGFEVAVGLPIVLNGELTAVMSLFYKGVRPKSEQLVELISAIAVQLAAAFQRKQFEEELYQSQQLAQATIDALNAQIAVLDEVGIIITVNRSWEKFALENNAVLSQVGVGSNYLAVCATAVGQEEPGAAEMLAGIRAVMSGERASFALEYPCDAPHQPRWFVARVTPLPGGIPQRHRVVVSHENITELKRAEQALRESEQHYRLLFDHNPQPMWVYDLETLRFLSVNDMAVQKYGYSKAEFLTMTLMDIRPTGDSPRPLADTGMKRPSLQHSGEWRHQLRDGQIIDVEITSHILNFAGRAAALMVAFDITERKLLEQERLSQAKRLQEILDTIPVGVVMLAEDRRITLANPQGERLLDALCGCHVGEQLEEINGRSLAHLLAPPQTGSSHNFEKEGRHFELLAHPISPQKAGSDWVLLLREVTEELERQNYLEVQNRLATVGQLAAGIAHDFNNVMAVIVLYSQMLQGIKEIPLRGQRYLETIVNQAQHAAKMIGQILDFSRRSVMEQAPLDLLPLLKEMVRLLKNTLPENIEIEFYYEPGGFLIMADPTRLQQALMNVALNARDAMPNGGKLRFALNALQIPTEQDAPLADMAPGNWLRLTISDSGIGISPEHLPHIFEPFYTTKEVGKGTGLGLAQLYGIIKQHEGSIDVMSVVGEGTAFIIYLPIYEDVSQAKVTPPADALTMTGAETVLVVEDSLTIRQSIVEALSGLGYRALEAENGLAALAVLAANFGSIDLILSDIMMPQMDGWALHKQVRQQYPGVKFLLMSGYPPQDREDASLAGMDWVSKPFSLSQLAEKLRASLG